MLCTPCSLTHRAVEVPEDGGDDEAAHDDHGHEALEGQAPAVDAGGQAGADLGEDLDGAAGEDEGHVGAQAKQGVELLGLVHRGDLVGKAPEQHGHHHGAPQLGHHVEQAVGPVADDGDGARPAGAHLRQQRLGPLCRQAGWAGRQVGQAGRRGRGAWGTGEGRTGGKNGARGARGRGYIDALEIGDRRWLVWPTVVGWCVAVVG